MDPLPAPCVKDLEGMKYNDMLAWVRRVAPGLVKVLIDGARGRLKRVFVRKTRKRSRRYRGAKARSVEMIPSVESDIEKNLVCVYVGSTALGPSEADLFFCLSRFASAPRSKV